MIHYYKFYTKEHELDSHVLSLKDIPLDSQKVKNAIHDWLISVCISTNKDISEFVDNIANICLDPIQSVSVNGHREEVSVISRENQEIIVKNYIRSFEIKHYGFATFPTK